MDWKTLDWSSPQARAMARDAAAHGIGNQGWAVPIWGPGGEFAFFILNHATDDARWSRFTREKGKEILLVSHLMHQQAMRIIMKETAGPTAELSPREREALTQLSLGQSRAAVADVTAHLGEHPARLYRFGAAQARGD